MNTNGPLKSYYGCNQSTYFPNPSDVAAYPTFPEVKSEPTYAPENTLSTEPVTSEPNSPLQNDEKTTQSVKVENGGQSPGFDSGHSDSGFSNTNHLNGYDSSNNGEKSMGRVTPDSSQYNPGNFVVVFWCDIS